MKYLLITAGLVLIYVIGFAGAFKIGQLTGQADLDRWMRSTNIARFQKVYECPHPAVHLQGLHAREDQ